MSRPTLWLAALSLPLAACFDSETLMRMWRQPKNLPYSESTFFEDGRSMRQLPEGTVPREHLGAIGPLERSQEAPDAGYVTQNPVPLTPAVLERGRRRFDIICANCHGLLGDGNSVAATKMSLRPPPSVYQFRAQPDGFFFDVITRGYGLMPSFAWEIPEDERWAVVAYVRALQLSQAAPLDLAPAPERQKLEGSP